jgi:type IV pilus assembly protein PilW
VFDGSVAEGVEEELIEGVETMQVQYGIDSNADNIRDGNYVAANAVSNWDTVMTVRVSLLLRTDNPMDGGNAMATSATVGGVTVTYPADEDGKRTDRFDRQVFTTTIALRNRIAYF